MAVNPDADQQHQELLNDDQPGAPAAVGRVQLGIEQQPNASFGVK
jgi:hypothetical protein